MADPVTVTVEVGVMEVRRGDKIMWRQDGTEVRERDGGRGDRGREERVDVFLSLAKPVRRETVLTHYLNPVHNTFSCDGQRDTNSSETDFQNFQTEGQPFLLWNKNLLFSSFSTFHII